MDEALFCQEVILKETALFHLETDSCIHIIGHHLADVGKLIFLEIFHAGGTFCDIAQEQTAERIGTAAELQSVVAAGDHIILAQLALEHLVVCKARFRTVEGGIDAHERKLIGSDVLIVFHRDVRYSLFQLCFHLQDDPSRLGIPRSHVGMGEGIQNRAVYMDQEQTDHFLRQFFIHILYKRIQQFVQCSQIYREICHAGHMFVKNQKGIQRLKKILRRIQLQEFASLSHKFRIIRDNIPGTERCVSLCQIADAL